MSIRSSQRGDTIIEVLFAMAIIGVVLGAAYATASKNLQVSQLAKERTQATLIAESQLEQLKALETEPTINDFCLDITQADPLIDPSNGGDCTQSDQEFEKNITKNGSEYKIVVEWIPPGGDDLNKANVTLAYKDFDFSSNGEAGLALFTLTSTGSSATLGASITNQPGVIPPQGIVYSTTPNPTVGGAGVTVLEDTSGTNRFNTIISGLDASTIYYARLYVNTSSGFKYSNTVAINGTGTSDLLNVATGTVSAITATGASVSGSVSSSNGWPVNARGIAYTTNSSSDPAGWTKVASGSGVGSFTGVLSGLTSGTTYYVRAYATTGTTTYYGESRNFAPVSYALTLANASAISYARATVSANLTGAGGTIQSRGIALHTRADFNSAAAGAGYKIRAGSNSTGVQTVTFTDLLPNKTYYYYAYAENSATGSMSTAVKSFTTSTIPAATYNTERTRGNSKYYKSTENVRWGTANTRATNLGGHLVTITSAGENTVVSGMSTPLDWGTWIGLEDLDDNSVWRWVTGEALSYTNWARGGVCGNQPEKAAYPTLPSGGRQTVAEMSMGYSTYYDSCTGFWNDEINTGGTNFTNKFIVEFTEKMDNY